MVPSGSSRARNLQGVAVGVSKMYDAAILIVVVRAVFAMAAGLAGLIGVSIAARPDPGPCRDTVTIPVSRSPMCVGPQADIRLVMGGATAAVAVAWIGSGEVKKRISRIPR